MVQPPAESNCFREALPEKFLNEPTFCTKAISVRKVGSGFGALLLSVRFRIFNGIFSAVMDDAPDTSIARLFALSDRLRERSAALRAKAAARRELLRLVHERCEQVISAGQATLAHLAALRGRGDAGAAPDEVGLVPTHPPNLSKVVASGASQGGDRPRAD